jgi:hypothetical protein
MTSLTEALDRLGPTGMWEGDWPEVLRRAGEAAPRRRRRLGRRRAVVLAFVVLAIVAPLTALSALNHWWVQGYLPRPVQQPIVVTRGSWSGHPWTLVAYPSYPSDKIADGYGLCWGVTFTRSARLAAIPPGGTVGAGVMTLAGVRNGVSCGSVVGIHIRHRIPGTVPTVMAVQTQTFSPRAYENTISGVVVASATHVVIRWSAHPVARPGFLTSPREVVRVATFPARVAGYSVRLFAAPQPKALLRRTRIASAWRPPSSVTGTNRHGRVVACSTYVEVPPLTDCKP